MTSNLGSWRYSDLQVRLRRRRLVHREELLSPSRFCRRKGISHTRLLELERRGKVFSVEIDHKRYLPALFADRSLNQRRLAKLLRRLPSRASPIAKYLFFVARRGSLGDKSPLQSTRRARRFRLALRLWLIRLTKHLREYIRGKRVISCDFIQ